MYLLLIYLQSKKGKYAKWNRERNVMVPTVNDGRGPRVHWCGCLRRLGSLAFEVAQ